MEHITAGDLQQMFADVADAGTYGCFEYQGIAVGVHADEAGPGELARHVLRRLLHRDGKRAHRCRGVQQPGSRHLRPHRIIYSREVDDATGTVEENCFVLSTPGRRVLVSSPGALMDRQDTVRRSLRNREKQDFLQDFFDLDGSTVQAAFDALLEKFVPRVAVVELRQNAHTNEDSAELVERVTHQLRERAGTAATATQL